MVKIKNVFGDEYKGKQKNAVYQKRYGKQIRRIKEDKKRNDAPAQREQQRRFRVGVAFYKSLTAEEKQALKEWLNERGITLTPQQYIIKTALDRGRATKETFTVEVSGRSIVESWHAPDWTYRQKIVITNNNSYDLIDYQVRLDLDSTKVGQNFDWSRNGEDLRFYDENGNKLSYYIESWDEVRRQATVWVKVGSIPGNGTADIFMYYGNENAESESDGAAVFDFWDDFNGTELDTSKWKKVGTLDYSLSDGRLTIWTSSAAVGFIQTRNNFQSRNIVFEAYGKHNSGAEVNHYIHNYDANENIWANKSWYRAETRGTDTYRIARYTQSDSSQTWLYRTSLEINIFRLYSVAIDDTNIKFYVDNVLKYSEACRLSELDRLYYSISLYNSGNGTIDWVRVRKYATIEPTATFYEEETRPVVTPQVIEVEHIVIQHAGIKEVYLFDENGEVITSLTDLSDIKSKQITTTFKFENDTGKPARWVMITSLAGTVNKVRL